MSDTAELAILTAREAVKGETIYNTYVGFDCEILIFV